MGLAARPAVTVVEVVLAMCGGQDPVDWHSAQHSLARLETLQCEAAAVAADAAAAAAAAAAVDGEYLAHKGQRGGESRHNHRCDP